MRTGFGMLGHNARPKTRYPDWLAETAVRTGRRAGGAACEAACRRGKVPRVDADGKFVAQDRPIAIRALKRFACDQVGPEVRPTDEVLRSVQSYVPEVSADAEEMAALLQASVAGAFEPARGDPGGNIRAGAARAG